MGKILGILYEDITKKIRGCIYNVHNEIGPGYDEEIYHQGLIISFKKLGIPYLSKERKHLNYRNEIIYFRETAVKFRVLI